MEGRSWRSGSGEMILAEWENAGLADILSPRCFCAVCFPCGELMARCEPLFQNLENSFFQKRGKTLMLSVYSILPRPLMSHSQGLTIEKNRPFRGTCTCGRRLMLKPDRHTIVLQRCPLHGDGFENWFWKSFPVLIKTRPGIKQRNVARH